MGSIEKTELPGNALLQSYARDGHYTDCYSTSVSQDVTHPQFVAAFYTTFLFRIERLILKWAVSRPSTDTEVMQLAEGQRDTFAAWRVEARDNNQLLLCDFRGKTRSWLMVETTTSEQVSTSRLYFGSAVVKSQSGDGNTSYPAGFSLLLGIHRVYSVALLYSAKRRLHKKGVEPIC